VLVGRSVDETGAVQPTRDALVGKRGAAYRYHYHALQSWAVSAGGEVRNVYV
jgi:sulfane dehydrogenase subunit SoxC